MDENLGDVFNDRISSITGCGLDQYYSKNALVSVLQRYLSESLVKSIVQELDGLSLTLPVIPTLTLSQSMRLVNKDVVKMFEEIVRCVDMLRDIYTVEGTFSSSSSSFLAIPMDIVCSGNPVIDFFLRFPGYSTRNINANTI